MVYPYNGILLSDEKEGTIDTHCNLIRLRIIILSERRPKKKALVPFTEKSRKHKLI